MKANELMIGDLVTESFIPTEHRVCRVAHIDGDMDSVVLYDIEDEDEYRIGRYAKHIEPIPLTEEMLKANGFEKREDDMWILRDRYHWYVEFYLDDDGNVVNIGSDINGKIGENNCHICYLNYVHELQHALRLCGLSDLADNFKIE